jgi:hypothetical protein
MSRADSPLAGRMIFNVGARRSGTFWLQRIVTAHPDVAAVPTESGLFSDGIAPLFERFHHGARSSPQLAALHVERDVLLDATRDFCDRVLAPLTEPGRRYLAERTPLHVYHVELMGAIYPDASFVHIIRDGRDVALSQIRQLWGPPTLAEAAEEWRSSVVTARSGDLPDRLLEVRYEELLARPEESFRALYEWLGLEVTPAIMAGAMAEAKSVANLTHSDPRVGAAKWRSSASDRDIAEIEAVAGPLLAELGYGVRDPSAGGGPAAARPSGSLVRGGRAAGRVRPLGALRGRLRAARGRFPARGRATALASRLRERLGAQPSRRGSPEATPGRVLIEGHRLVDGLLSSIHTGRLDDLTDLLEERASVRLVTGDRVWEGRGAAAREALAATLSEDLALTGRQVRGEVLSGSPAYSAVLTYELPSGERRDRLVFARLRAGRVRELVVYRLGEEAAGG